MESDLYRDLAPVAPVAPDFGSDLTWDLHLSSLSGLVLQRFIQRFTHYFPV